MNKEEQNSIDSLKNWIKEAGTDSLGSEFHLSVLNKIEALPKTSSTYEPVISPFAWKLIFIFIAGIFGGSIIFFPSSENNPSLFDKIPPIKLPSFSLELYNFSFPTINFAPPFIMGIAAFFILGFIMIAGTIRDKQTGV
ncbi:hypothetical protein [Algoriphagus sp.]|uniref:hypothetical protein n=1 Tax=Algoriphagus sp. TaxID=1872435 RepID=UPI003918AC20